MQYNDCWGNTVYKLTSAILKGVPTHSRGLELEELSGSFQASCFMTPVYLGILPPVVCSTLLWLLRSEIFVI